MTANKKLYMRNLKPARGRFRQSRIFDKLQGTKRCLTNTRADLFALTMTYDRHFTRICLVLSLVIKNSGPTSISYYWLLTVL